jgi:hypothetical protein
MDDLSADVVVTLRDLPIPITNALAGGASRQFCSPVASWLNVNELARAFYPLRWLLS